MICTPRGEVKLAAVRMMMISSHISRIRRSWTDTLHSHAGRRCANNKMRTQSRQTLKLRFRATSKNRRHSRAHTTPRKLKLLSSLLNPFTRDAVHYVALSCITARRRTTPQSIRCERTVNNITRTFYLVKSWSIIVYALNFMKIRPITFWVTLLTKKSKHTNMGQNLSRWNSKKVGYYYLRVKFRPITNSLPSLSFYFC